MKKKNPCLLVLGLVIYSKITQVLQGFIYELLVSSNEYIDETGTFNLKFKEKKYE